MDKGIIMYIILVVISVSIFYIIAQKKCNGLKRKEEELKAENEISNSLAFLFNQILGNK